MLDFLQPTARISVKFRETHTDVEIVRYASGKIGKNTGQLLGLLCRFVKFTNVSSTSVSAPPRARMAS